MTNKSAGVAIWIGQGINETDVKLIQVPPLALAGRGLAMRIKTRQFDLMAMVLHYPPKTQLPREMNRYKQTVRQLSSWSSDVLKMLPSRCTPIIYADVNDDLEPMEGDAVVGDFPYGESKAEASRLFRKSLDD